MAAPLCDFALRMGDNALILGQQVSAWCGHAPVLEEDIALANMALDLIGQAKLWLGFAGEVEGEGRTADNLAYLRDSREFQNFLLVEQENGDFGKTLMRQFLFDAWHHPMLTGLTSSSNASVAEIAAKAVKEAKYHLERSADLVIRLGDGTQESHDRMQDAVNALWPFTAELTEADAIDEEMAATGVALPVSDVTETMKRHVAEVFQAAALSASEDVFMRRGGKTGMHTEHMGYVLAEMQSVHRAHPGAQW